MSISLNDIAIYFNIMVVDYHYINEVTKSETIN